MAIIISQIETSFNAKPENIIALAVAIAEKHGAVSGDILTSEIYKTSLDARKQDHIKLVNSVYLELADIELEQRICEAIPNCILANTEDFKPDISNKKVNGRVVVVGFGPCGMLCALTLAEHGYRPVVLERGSNVDKRVNDVHAFWTSNQLNENSNVQFGEGGAGTFSDGKLTTRIKDNLCSYVMKKLVEMGAPSEILTKAKPHIGTDKLRFIVKTIRERIISLGGEVYFDSKVTDISITNGKVTAVSTDTMSFETSNLVLAVGHSARDIFNMLLTKNVFIQPKAFSVGARIEHTQESVNKSLYGKYYDNPMLPKGEYQLSHNKNGRGVYTFCMCPGGLVIPSSSEVGTVVTNGMSTFSRDGRNASSAVVVSVSPDDFGKNPLDGLNFARSIEHKAFELGGCNYSAPAISVGNFLGGTYKNSTIGTLKGGVVPSYSCGVKVADFDSLFPSFVTESMREGLRVFSRKMDCFGDKTAVFTAPETRTSSPIRITRGENFQSISVKGLYPSGEGAGYAGGIVSSAVDGVKVAFSIMR